jgi:hypothetical protein
VVAVFLTRLPSHGRETARHLRRAKATRALPILLVGGPAEAVEKARAAVPDATFVSPDDLNAALARLRRSAAPQSEARACSSAS